PSGLNASELTCLVWPLRKARCCPLATSQIMMVLFLRAEARVLPFGLNAKTPPALYSPVCSCPLATFHSLMFPPLLKARVLPSGLNASGLTPPIWTLKEAHSCPLAMSNNLIVPSQLPEARVLPSGLNAKGLSPPLKEARTAPLVTSHSSMPSFQVPVARVLPSGLNTTE